MQIDGRRFNRPLFGSWAGSAALLNILGSPWWGWSCGRIAVVVGETWLLLLCYFFVVLSLCLFDHKFGYDYMQLNNRLDIRYWFENMFSHRLKFAPLLAEKLLHDAFTLPLLSTNIILQPVDQWSNYWWIYEIFNCKTNLRRSECFDWNVKMKLYSLTEAWYRSNSSDIDFICLVLSLRFCW